MRAVCGKISFVQDRKRRAFSCSVPPRRAETVLEVQSIIYSADGGGGGSSGPDTRFCPLLLGLGSLRDEAGERNDPGKHVGLQERRRAGRGGGGGGVQLPGEGGVPGEGGDPGPSLPNLLFELKPHREGKAEDPPPVGQLPRGEGRVSRDGHAAAAGGGRGEAEGRDGPLPPEGPDVAGEAQGQVGEGRWSRSREPFPSWRAPGEGEVEPEALGEQLSNGAGGGLRFGFGFRFRFRCRPRRLRLSLRLAGP